VKFSKFPKKIPAALALGNEYSFSEDVLDPMGILEKVTGEYHASNIVNALPNHKQARMSGACESLADGVHGVRQLDKGDFRSWNHNFPDPTVAHLKNLGDHFPLPNSLPFLFPFGLPLDRLSSCPFADEDLQVPLGEELLDLPTFGFEGSKQKSGDLMTESNYWPETQMEEAKRESRHKGAGFSQLSGHRFGNDFSENKQEEGTEEKDNEFIQMGS